MNRPTSRQGERGQTILLVAISLVAMLGLSALAIDVVTLYVSRAEAQRAADSGALAGAQMLVTLGVTADPCNAALQNAAIGLVTTQAQAVAQKNNIAGAPAQMIAVNFPNQGSIGTCPGAFGINPQVMVNLQRTGLPTFFSRIWGPSLGSVSATATAEAYNPSDAGSVSTSGTVVPIAPRCPKPILLPNCDPTSTGTGVCDGVSNTLVNPVTGAISRPGAGGVIGQIVMMLKANCGITAGCTPSPPAVGQYYPLGLPATALHLCPGCSTSSGGFQQDLECCNASTLACGQPASVDYTLNPNGVGQAAATGGQCLIHQNPGGGQDSIIQEFPAIFTAGPNNPFVGTSVQANDIVMNSDSVITIPLYDGLTTPQTGTPVTIIGYLQVFVDMVNADGSMKVTVLNVSGCGNAPTGAAIQGAATSVPVRLIQAQ